MKKIAVVEDNDDMQLLYKLTIRRIPEVKLISQSFDAEEAEEAFKQDVPDLAIIDISLPGKSGVEFAKEVHQNYPDIKILMATGFDPDAYYAAAKEAGADDFIVKGDTNQIIEKIKKLLNI